MTIKSQTTTLHCTANGSHKQYCVSIDVHASGTADVRVAYGRINAHSLNQSHKERNVLPATAHATAEKLIRAKLKKGYVIHTTIGNLEAPPAADPVEHLFKKPRFKAATIAQTNASIAAIAQNRPRRRFSVAI